ncbi:MAG TPA: hypothetical protein VGM94_14435 [Galbitalea sp.]|jgi:hypothetical protein
MDLSTGHMAYTIHAQDARRADQEREYRRRAKERAAGLPAAPDEGAAEVAAQPQRRHGAFASSLFRRHRAAAQ